jgi:glycosyltransferase involved in cell wall biosynthesis
MAQYVDHCAAQPTVMDTQDVATVSAYRRTRTTHNPLVKGYYFVQWLFWLRYEARFYARFAKVLTLTEQDATALRIFTPELDVHVGAVGVEIPSALPKLGAQQQSIGFLANFAHLPNVDAARYFISEILPLIRRELPAVKFLVAGKNPPVTLLREAGPGVDFVGYVEDVSSFYAGVELVVAPLRLGGGIKIKVLEAMACGKPVITTSIGAEGIAAQNEGALLICDTPAEMAREVVRLLREPDQAKRVGDGGQQLVVRRFSWEKVTEDLGDMYAGLVRSAP